MIWALVCAGWCPVNDTGEMRHVAVSSTHTPSKSYTRRSEWGKMNILSPMRWCEHLV